MNYDTDPGPELPYDTDIGFIIALSIAVVSVCCIIYLATQGNW